MRLHQSVNTLQQSNSNAVYLRVIAESRNADEIAIVGMGRISKVLKFRPLKCGEII